MNKFAGLMAAAILSISIPAVAVAADLTKGTVKKIDLKSKKVTIIHEELKNLDMPAMTMVFRVADEAMLESVQEGQEIEFAADRVNGNLTVIEINE
ncbi:copper-binding protein [Roseibium salinum]|uniref:Copper-binding protein n=1 Tax=Roseibium salinum TaxID=1604349 RepID=A0ABT3R8V3_9HYPH|nr:copper-binding protein [Roseibium sp. DSM 29163]MCX2725742.1 copper-binding protein [Roseibium sp. DSM 29163]